MLSFELTQNLELKTVEITMSKEQQKIPDDPRVGILSLIIRLGHESFKKKDLRAKVTHILNNSRLISPYERACLIDNTAEQPKIIGVTGEESVNQNSEYSIAIRDLLFPILPHLSKPTELNAEFIGTLPDSEKILQYYEKYLLQNPSSTLLLVPLSPPEGGNKSFIWVAEYFTPPPETEANKMGLLAQSYSESLWYSLNSSKNIYKTLGEKTKHKRSLIAFFIFVTLLLVLFILRVDLNVSSDFEIISADNKVEYAPYAGKIAEVFVKNGQFVNKGEALIKYDTQELMYDLSKAKTSYNETAAKLDITRQRSFNDDTALPEVRVLELQKERDKISIDKIKWYIDHSLISAQIAGMAIIEDEKYLQGKAVNAGEKLLEIVSNDHLIAEIFINEKDAVVLEKISSISLYLYSMPEKSIKAELISISPRAEFSNNRQFCFIVKASLGAKESVLVYGTRGIARVSGERVSLAYYLFRNTLLWWRTV